MDFSAWFEAYLGGRWYTFDARHNMPRIGRILMARGRDATDVAIVTSLWALHACGLQGHYRRGDLKPRFAQNVDFSFSMSRRLIDWTVTRCSAAVLQHVERDGGAGIALRPDLAIEIGESLRVARH